MPLSVRPTSYVVPAYSLTGDLLAYQNCGLQYRYHNRGALPPSKPVQLWFGQFIHGVMEESYRTYIAGGNPLPWGDSQLLPIADLIIRRLAARGIQFQRFQLLGIALERAYAAVNTWGAYLFPLISEAEVRLRGIRPLPPNTDSVRESGQYEVEGVADVITSVRLTGIADPNPLVNALLISLAGQAYEVVVDYKGMRRPSQSEAAWRAHEQQILTYGWLRRQQPQAATVRSGMLLYLNELVPGVEDMQRLYEDAIQAATPQTDVTPSPSDQQALRAWPRERRRWQTELEAWYAAIGEWWRAEPADRGPLPRMPRLASETSAEYRRERSLRTIPVDDERIAQSLDYFDEVVGAIESSVARESRAMPLITAWVATPRDENCTVCDFRTFCPAPGNRYRGVPEAP